MSASVDYFLSQCDKNVSIQHFSEQFDIVRTKSRKLAFISFSLPPSKDEVSKRKIEGKATK